jgi:hypothetical protein
MNLIQFFALIHHFFLPIGLVLLVLELHLVFPGFTLEAAVILPIHTQTEANKRDNRRSRHHATKSDKPWIFQF